MLPTTIDQNGISTPILIGIVVTSIILVIVILLFTCLLIMSVSSIKKRRGNRERERQEVRGGRETGSERRERDRE